MKTLWKLPPAFQTLLWFRLLSGLRAGGGSGGGCPSPGRAERGEAEFLCDLEPVGVCE